MLNPVEIYGHIFKPRSDIAEDQQQAIKTLLFYLFFGLLVGIYSAFKWQKYEHQALIFSSLALIVIALVASGLLRAGWHYLLVGNLALSGMVLHAMNIIYQSGGLLDSPHLYWLPTLSLLSYLATNRLWGNVWTAILFCLGLAMLLAHFNGASFPQMQLPEKAMTIELFSGFLLPLLLLWIGQNYALRLRDQAYQQAKQAQLTNQNIAQASEHSKHQLQQVVEHASDSSTQLVSSATDMSSTVQEMNNKAAQIAQSSADQHQSISQINQNLSQMEKVLAQANQATEQLLGLSQQASGNAEESAQAISQTEHSMQKILSSNQQINSVTDIISDIANQTNLLALNAAIEAARAGEQGRGFSVVADQVRELSLRSSQSTQQIRSLLETCSADVQQGHQVVEQSGQILHNIITLVKDISEGVGQMAQVMQQQAVTVAEIINVSSQVSDFSQHNSKSSSALLDNTEQLTGIANQLQDMASQLHQTVASHQR
ncbi:MULTISPECIES: methyl-accepting chemotaxis protein [unclassified Agarivorans]|uniref:methyl-accepting chemotaxis protein n=1 Tax=unclassified Agarivorans TaxID=2636026 RepID=UPI0026E13C4D|nr:MULTISPECIES: methyl-accepting chemotaxis protein [unclassified Agarivorans]MDO6684657.1 methyl-accepting chemotaxis protein [Agarivorans sp. 3_MG-2023]MDO6714822.1 methyl-accepting chemotaxis protein [Agarivorans sp. 2_MG-2023]